jgi:hypothetical protein
MKKYFLIVILLLMALFSTAWSQESNPREIRPVQVTFVTPLGTNGIDAPEIANKFSLNIIAGVNGGVDGVEIGGMVNVITGGVEGVQVAGLGNYVHLETKGVQVAGLFNVDRGHFEGIQVGGLANLSFNGGQGMQVAGLANFAAGDINAGQVAGLVNLTLGNTQGIQVGGLYSISAETHDGPQISGLGNVAGQISGIQVSGIANYATRVSGIQVGLVNIADSVGGLQIGLLSYAGNGHMALGVQTNETFQGQLVYKMGIKRLYNIYVVAGREGANRYWAPGLGLGTYLFEQQRTSLNLEGIAFQVNEDEWWTNTMNMLARVNLNFQYRVIQNLSILGGISLNQAISQVSDAEGKLTGGAFVPDWTFTERTRSRTKTALYPGLNVGVEFQLR